jgi:GT2 family glycosyltransferase
VQEAIQNIDAEIIVVDNNSDDDSCQMIKSRFPNVKLIENNGNLGFPKEITLELPMLKEN